MKSWENDDKRTSEWGISNDPDEGEMGTMALKTQQWPNKLSKGNQTPHFKQKYMNTLSSEQQVVQLFSFSARLMSVALIFVSYVVILGIFSCFIC